MIVNSNQLLKAAATLREQGVATRKLADAWDNVEVSAAQLETAAGILQDAEPSVITNVRASSGSFSNLELNKPQERPGYISSDHQLESHPEILVFVVGILPSTHYYIDREGELVEHPEL